MSNICSCPRRNSFTCSGLKPHGHIPRFFWAVQPAVRQALHALNPSNAYTFSWRAYSRSQQAPQGHINGFFWASKLGVTRFKPFQRFNILLACLIPRPTSTPRPHQWLLMGVQACRLPAFKPLKPLKPSKSLAAAHQAFWP